MRLLIFKIYLGFCLYYHTYWFFFPKTETHVPMAPIIFPILKDLVWISFVFLSLLYILMKKIKGTLALTICRSGRRHILCIGAFFCLYLATATVHFVHKYPVDILQHNIRNTIWYSPIILLLPLYLRDNEDIGKVVRFLIFNGVIIALFGIFSRFVKPESLLLDGNRVLSTMGNPNNLAFFLNILFFMTLSRLLLEKIMSKKLILLLLLFIACILFTISLTNVLALLLGTALIFLLTHNLKRGVAVFLFMCVLGLVLLNVGFLDGIVLKYNDMFDNTSTLRSYFGRIQQAREIGEFLKNANLGSIAFGDFSLERYRRYDSQYWNILRNDGFLILCLFLLVFLSVIYTGFVKSRCLLRDSDLELAAITLGITISLTTTLLISFSGSPFLNRFPLNLLTYLFIGIILFVRVPRFSPGTVR